ncbi:MAG: metal ABC transporter substrate-binding protein [bacterium]
MMKNRFRVFAAAVAAFMSVCVASSGAIAAPLRVVTTTEDIAAIAREVGGGLIEVEALARGYQDPHFVDAKPSFLVKLSKADLFVQVGGELEVGWVPVLLNNARNPRVAPGGKGFVDASANVQKLEVPANVTRAAGDVHPYGNPHTWLAPANGALIAATLRDAFSAAAPEHAAEFASRTADFERRLAEKRAVWEAKAKAIGLTGAPVVTYHRSWTYFAAAFGCDVVDFVEPRPGVPPTPSHIRELENLMRIKSVKILIVEPYFDVKLPEKIARDTGATLVILPPSVGAEPAIKTYFDLFDRQLAILEAAIVAPSGS